MTFRQVAELSRGTIGLAAASRRVGLRRRAPSACRASPVRVRAGRAVASGRWPAGKGLGKGNFRQSSSHPAQLRQKTPGCGFCCATRTKTGSTSELSINLSSRAMWSRCSSSFGPALGVWGSMLLEFPRGQSGQIPFVGPVWGQQSIEQDGNRFPGVRRSATSSFRRALRDIRTDAQRRVSTHVAWDHHAGRGPILRAGHGTSAACD